MKLYNLVVRMVFLIVRYINKMATDGGSGVVDSMVDGRHSDNCKRHIGPGLKSQPGYFSVNVCMNSYKQIHTTVIQIVSFGCGQKKIIC